MAKLKPYRAHKENQHLDDFNLKKSEAVDKIRKEYWDSVDDEICQCGHSKGYHVGHQFDRHGGACDKKDCDCDLYTWVRFVKYGDPKE